MSKVEIYQTREGDALTLAAGGGEQRWRWRVKAGNNEIVASGEAYTSEQNARRGFLNARDVMNEAFENLNPITQGQR